MREIWWAANPVTSRPSISTRPLEGGRSPASMLMSVDLPAPFGPITACSSPMRASSETSLTAAKPPKWRVSFLVARTTSPTGRPPALEQRGAHAQQSPRQQQRSEHDEAAHPELPVLAEVDFAEGGAHRGQSLQTETEQHPNSRANDRPGQRAHPSENHPHHHRAREVPAHHLGI